MRPRLDALLRTTTFRLALVQAGVVLAFVVALLLYIYFATADQLIRDSDDVTEQEYVELERAYSEGGIRRLEQEIVARTTPDSPMVYALADTSGVVIAGTLPALPETPAGGTARRTDFRYDRTDASGATENSRARGQIGRLVGPLGPTLLVARDLGDNAEIAGRITRALWTVAGVGILLSFVSGLTAAWQAARRAEALSITARDVMAGDLARRAPVRGIGDEFDALAEDMNAMLDRIEHLVQTTRTAGDAIAHDLRSPLTRFRQKLESALERPPNPESDRAALNNAVDEADRVVDMFNAVLKLARVEAAGSWRFERVDLTAVLQELVDFYAPAAEEQGLAFGGDVAKQLSVNGETGLVTQAVSNLIENALKYTPSGGRVEVRAARRHDARVEILVMDNGPGVPPEDRERVLERFVRLETARASPGVGLGLSLVSAVAKLHRGSLHLQDGLDNGAGCGLGAALVLPAADAR